MRTWCEVPSASRTTAFSGLASSAAASWVISPRMLRAVAPARAYGPPGRAQVGRFVSLPGVESTQRKRPVQHDRTRLYRVAHRKRLGEVGAVGIAVDVDLGHMQDVQDVLQIVGRGTRAVGVGRHPQVPGACAGGAGEIADVLLQPGTVDRARESGAAVVHQDQVVTTVQRSQHVQVGRRRPGGRDPRAALVGHHRLQRWQRVIGVPVHPEVHRQRSAERGRLAVERHLDRAAQHLAAPRALLDHGAAVGERRPGAEAHARSHDRKASTQTHPEPHSPTIPGGDYSVMNPSTSTRFVPGHDHLERVCSGGRPAVGVEHPAGTGATPLADRGRERPVQIHTGAAAGRAARADQARRRGRS